MTGALASLRGVGRAYARPDGDVAALDSVSLDVPRGALVAVVGPSGSGKSTLLHVLGLLDRPTAGAYHLDGIDVSALDDRARSRLRGRRVAFVFQAFHLVPHLTVVENVELGLAYRGVGRAERRVLAAAALDRVGLAGRARHLPDELSGGERQRGAIARALAVRPLLLLADEPTGNLDDASADVVLALFSDARSAGASVVVVTHNARVAASADECHRLEGGRLVAA